MTKKIHIISFDNPFPPNYGGVIDVYYKLQALAEAGVDITLHVFEYGREPNEILNKWCKEVHYYARRKFVNPFIGTLPYIVTTRNDEQLLTNLLVDDAPILFEGLHSCFYLNDTRLAHRKRLVRMHNIEHEYYRKLEEVENNFFKKYFFSKEAERLQRYESVLQYADVILGISPNDCNYLSQRYEGVKLLPAFHANSVVTCQVGQGNFAFYHGNLSVGENDEAAKFLVREVFSKINVPLTIAGNKPSAQLKAMVDEYAHITLLENATTERITELTQQAHINVLPTFQNTGIKLKLINVLYQGRWVVANDMMVANTGLDELCEVANTASEMASQIARLMQKEFTTIDIDRRKKVLLNSFNNTSNIQCLISCI